MRAFEINTEHLLLRRFTLDDAEEYFPLLSLSEVLKYTGEQAKISIDEARQVLQDRPLRDYSLYGFGRMACIEKSSGRLIGFSGLKYLEMLDEIDIGYRFLPDCWGKGYATESARALMQDGIEQHGITRIVGMVFPQNAASARVLNKLGLVWERKIKLDDVDHEIDLHAMPGTKPGDSLPLRRGE